MFWLRTTTCCSVVTVNVTHLHTLPHHVHATRYNVKRRVDKKPPVSEADFEALIEQHQDDVSSSSSKRSSGCCMVTGGVVW